MQVECLWRQPWYQPHQLSLQVPNKEALEARQIPTSVMESGEEVACPTATCKPGTQQGGNGVLANPYLVGGNLGGDGVPYSHVQAGAQQRGHGGAASPNLGGGHSGGGGVSHGHVQAQPLRQGHIAAQPPGQGQ